MRKLIDSMNAVVHIFLVLLMAELVITVLCQILFRLVLNQPLAWTEELSRYSLIWITFLGAAYALSKRAHIGMELLVERVRGMLKTIMIVLAGIISMMFFFIMIKEGITLSNQVMNQPSPVLQIPMGLVYAVVPISGVILMVNLLDVTVQQIKEEAK
ncbi:TRAP transporter small permease [Lysinibacillus sp. KU-BSD001]|uniref:TRAP transporter small permease n=1 Tax=Lysinibacillus sp. KU-BSD001 TaxID=3141328 RepID=UPI0036DFB71A